MAQWNRRDRVLHGKVVYYGPAFGGKTTNLETLHRATDPDERHRLTSVRTADDRTLFFDLLPLEIGAVLGHRVAFKLYTVPGQPHYEATRRVVLSGADAVVFVADTTPGREADNRASYEDLRHNLLANRLRPDAIPIVWQLNKQDVEGALDATVMREVLGLGPGVGVPAIATVGDGVLETFAAACRAFLARVATSLDVRSRPAVDLVELGREVDAALEPLFERRVRERLHVRDRTPSAATPRTEIVTEPEEDARATATRGAMEIAELAVDVERRAERLDREASAMRTLSEFLKSTGAVFDEARIEREAVLTVARVLDAEVVSFLAFDDREGLEVRELLGADREPLASRPDTHETLRALVHGPRVHVVESLEKTLPGCSLRAAGGVPIRSSPPRAVVAYARAPDGAILPQDRRFLETVAAHLEIAFEKVAMHRALERRGAELERDVAERTAALTEAHARLARLDEARETLLGSISHEMRTPLTAIHSAAAFLRDYEGEPEARREMIEAVLAACRTLETHVARTLRLVRLRRDDRPRSLERVAALDVVERAIAGYPDASILVAVEAACESIRVDPGAIAIALSNLVDNAVKFSPEGAEVAVEVSREATGEVALRVLDRGPGIPGDEIQRLFEPFEQGGDPTTEKPRGIGLGLAEARFIAESHGGTLAVAPRAGGGAEFRMALPPTTLGEGDSRDSITPSGCPVPRGLGVFDRVSHE